MAKTFRREFQFIDSQDENARRKSRTHVTREFYRHVRWRQSNGLDAAEPKTANPALPHTKSKFIVSVTKLDKQVAKKQDENSSAYGTDTSPTTHDSFKQGRSFHTRSISPKSLLGAGRVDPFQTYPVEATLNVHQLVDHYRFVIPSLFHKQRGRRISHAMPIMDLFEVYRQDPVTFLAMLHHAAHHIGKMRSSDTEDKQTLEYKYKTLKMLNERLANRRGPCDDHTIVATGLLANAERIWGDQSLAQLHWDATKRMILDRGGFPALKDNHLVHTKLIWSFIALSGVSPMGNHPYSDNFAESVADEHNTTDLEGQSSFARSYNEFVSFLTARKAQALRALPTSQADQDRRAKFPWRSICFRPDTSLFCTLAAVDVAFDCPEKRRAVDNCRLACLIYLNAVLLEYGDFSPETEQFFKLFANLVEDDDFDCALTAEHLLWSLLRGIEPRETHSRIWLVSRMIGVVKRADKHVWQKTENALRTFLIMPEDGAELMATIAA